jgi:hypothetical protein
VEVERRPDADEQRRVERVAHVAHPLLLLSLGLAVSFVGFLLPLASAPQEVALPPPSPRSFPPSSP